MTPCQTLACLRCTGSIRQTLPGFHALTGANITGHRTQGKRKRTYFKMILKHILDLTFYGYFNTYVAGITSFF